MIFNPLWFLQNQRRLIRKDRNLIRRVSAFLRQERTMRIFMGGYTYDKTEPLKASDTSVTFDYFGNKIVLPITVTEKIPTKISVLTAPAKVQYTVGNALDLSGVKLQITYNDGSQSPVFEADELDKYGVHVAFGKSGSFTTITADKVLESDDSGSTIVFYATDKLPSEYGAVVAASSTITVLSPLTVPALDMYVSAGKSEAQYPYTDNMSGGSDSYATTVIKENLPAGLKCTNLPGESYNAFGYEGIVTASVGDYSSQYEIRDTKTQESIPGAFSNCANLVDLNIKENVTEIGDNAFADSKNLKNIYFYGNCPKLGNDIFKNVTATVYYPYIDKTWSLDILQDYGGTITWIPWDPETKSPAKRSLDLCDVKVTGQTYVYDRTEKTPEITIMDGNYTLQKDTDYTVKYSNNIHAGNAELEITGAGNYGGTYKTGFLIEQASPNLKFARKTRTVKYGTKPFLCALSEKTTDGTITYSSSNPKVATVDPSTGKITIKGGGTAVITAYAAKGTNYTSGSTSCTIKVTKRSNTIKASNIRRTWYAKARKVNINAKVYGKAPLKYSSNSKYVKVDKNGKITIAAKFTGSAKITIRSSATAGYYAASKSITVTVNPVGTTLTNAKNLTGRKAQITWKRNSNVTGYEIQYSVNKNFRSSGKKTVQKASATKYTLTKLQKNKTYYVRIRTYKKAGTKKYYSSWSKVKAVRIRK